MSKLFSPAAAAYIAGRASGRIPCPPVGENGSALAVTAPVEPGQRAGIRLYCAYPHCPPDCSDCPDAV